LFCRLYAEVRMIPTHSVFGSHLEVAGWAAVRILSV
jgi:hypothetical protein